MGRRVPSTVTTAIPSQTEAGWKPRRSHHGSAMGSQKNAPVTKGVDETVPRQRSDSGPVRSNGVLYGPAASWSTG